MLGNEGSGGPDKTPEKKQGAYTPGAFKRKKEDEGAAERGKKAVEFEHQLQCAGWSKKGPGYISPADGKTHITIILRSGEVPITFKELVQQAMKGGADGVHLTLVAETLGEGQEKAPKGKDFGSALRGTDPDDAGARQTKKLDIGMIDGLDGFHAALAFEKDKERVRVLAKKWGDILEALGMDF